MFCYLHEVLHAVIQQCLAGSSVWFCWMSQCHSVTVCIIQQKLTSRVFSQVVLYWVCSPTCCLSILSVSFYTMCHWKHHASSWYPRHTWDSAGLTSKTQRKSLELDGDERPVLSVADVLIEKYLRIWSPNQQVLADGRRPYDLMMGQSCQQGWL
jgi:hypothetical protein